jgi:hypothetical protein
LKLHIYSPSTTYYFYTKWPNYSSIQAFQTLGNNNIEAHLSRKQMASNITIKRYNHF